MPPETPAKADETPQPPQVPIVQLLGVFLRLGILAIGGGVQAYMYRELVDLKRWVDEKTYLTGFAVAQVLPGANPVNLALYFGLHLRGGLGATVAVLGMVVPAFCIILGMGYAYRQLAHFPATHFILVGVASVGVAATLAMGIKIAKRMDHTWNTVLIGLVTFGLVGVLRLPMVPVVLVVVPASILLAYWVERRRAG
ncbi:MAG: chromate transporter [Xanthobacteraceae bacterium]